MPSNGRSCLQRPATEIRRFAGLLLTIAIAAYAIHGLFTDDLVMPYHWRTPVKHWGSLHLRGMWAIGGSVCLLLGAVGLAILAYGVVGTKPGADPRARFSRNLATPLIWIGAVFFLGISWFAQWFVR